MSRRVLKRLARSPGPRRAAHERLAELVRALGGEDMAYDHASRRRAHVRARRAFVAERLGLGLTLREIAEEMGMAPSTVHRLARQVRVAARCDA